MQAGASPEARVLNRANLPLLMPRTTPRTLALAGVAGLALSLAPL